MGDRIKWNDKYRDSSRVAAMRPPEFLISHADEVLRMLPDHPRTLDLAAGAGRNSIFLAGRGCRVLAVDFALEGLRNCMRRAAMQGLHVQAVAADLKTFVFPAGGYDLLVNFFFLQREIFPAMINALNPGGILVFETYTSHYQAVHRGRSMRREYLLEPGELQASFPGLSTVFHEETAVTDRLIAQNPHVPNPVQPEPNRIAPQRIQRAQKYTRGRAA